MNEFISDGTLAEEKGRVNIRQRIGISNSVYSNNDTVKLYNNFAI